MAGRRKLEIEIASAAKGDGFKKSEKEATVWSKKLGEEGQKAGANLSKGVETGSSGLGDKLKGFGAKAGEMFKGAMLAGGALAGAALVTGFMGHLENEAMGDRLAAQLGGSEWAQGMGEVAGDMYVDGFGQSVGDTASALKAVLQNGLLPEDATNAQIQALTGDLMQFVDIFEQDFDMSTQAVSSMLKNRLAKDGTEALDLLTRGAQQGADKAGDLAETFQEYGVQFSALGLSGADAVGLLTQGLDGNARSADLVADALKEFTIRGKDLAESTTEGYKAIGLNADKMRQKVAGGGAGAREALDQVLDGLRGIEDPVKRNAAAVGLFGTQAEDLQGALFSLDLDSAAQGLGGVEGALRGTDAAYKNTKNSIELFKREALMKVTDFIGTSVMPKLEQFSDWAKDNPVAIKAMGAVIVGVFGAWAVAAGIAAISTSALTLPILLIGLAVAGLAVLFVTHWDTIKGAVMAAFDWIKTNWPIVLAILTGPIGLAVLVIVKHWDTIKAGALAAKDWVVEKFGQLVGFVTELPGKIARGASGLWDGILNGMVGVINKAIGWINELIRAYNRIPGVGNVGTIGKIGGSKLGQVAPKPGSGGGSGGPVRAMAEGGIIRARPGGTLVMAAEAGVDEAFVPLDGRHGLGGGNTYVFNLANHGVLGSEHEVREWLYRAVSSGIENGLISDRGRRL